MASAQRRGKRRNEKPEPDIGTIGNAQCRAHPPALINNVWNEQNGNVESESVASTSTSNRRNNLQFIVAAPSHLCILGQNMKC